MSETTGLATLSILLEIKNGELVPRVLDDVASRGEKAERSLGALEKTAKTLEQTFAALGIALGLLEMLRLANETAVLAARYQTLGVAMEVVGRNAGFARGEMADLQESLERAGLSGSAAREALTKMAEAQISLAKASELATVAQDAAVIANTTASDAMERLIQGVATGQQRVLRSIGIYVDFAAVHKRLADSMHETAADLTDAEKRQANLNAVLTAGAAIAGTYQAALGTAGQQMKEASRDLEILKEKVGQAFLPEYTGAVTAYADSLRYLGEHAPQVAGAITGIAAALAGLAIALKGESAVTGLFTALTNPAVLTAMAGMAALGTLFYSSATNAALLAKEAADATEQLKHMSAATLEHAIASAKMQLATTKSWQEFAHLTGVIQQYTAALNANRAAAPPPPAEDDGLSQKTLQKIAELQAETDKVRTLNGAYMQSALALQVMGIQLDGAIKKAREHKEAKEAEWPAIDHAVDALTREQVAAAKLAATKRADQDLIALNATNAAMVQSAIDAGHLADAQAAVSLAQLQGSVATEQAQNAYEHLQIALDTLAKTTAAKVALDRALVGATQQEIDAATAQYNATLRAIDAERGIRDATVDRVRAILNLKSVLQDVDEVMAAAFGKGRLAIDKLSASLADLFSRLSSNKNLASAFAGLGVGYSVGQQTSNGGLGVLEGAVSGAATGNQLLPGGWGAVIGGLTGAAGGLIGASQAQADAARALRQAAESFGQRSASFLGSAFGGNAVGPLASIDQQAKELNDALNAFANTTTPGYLAALQAITNAAEALRDAVKFSFVSDLGQQLNALNGPAGAFANSIDAINKKYNENVKTARDLKLGEGALDEAEQIRVKSIQQLILAEANLDNVTQGLLSRMFSITGGSDLGADPFASIKQAIADATKQGQTDLAGSLTQELGLDQQFKVYVDGLQAAKDAAAAQAGIDQANQSLLQAQLSTLKNIQTGVQSQVDAAQKAADATQQVVDTLAASQDALKLNTSLTVLTPYQQLQEAQRQFHALLSSAMTGDASAASGLPQAQQSLLTVARGYYGSSSGYQQIFGDSQAGIHAVQDQFGQQLDVQQLMLRELQKQNDTLTAQSTLLQGQLDAAKSNGGQAEIQALIAKVQYEAQLAPSGQFDKDRQLLSYSLIYGSVSAAQRALGQAYAGQNANLASGNVYTQQQRDANNAANGWIFDPNTGGWTNPDPNMPWYGRGANHPGGWRVVGDTGPEMERTGASRIDTAAQFNAPTVTAIKELRDEIRELRRGVVAQIATHGTNVLLASKRQ